MRKKLYYNGTVRTSVNGKPKQALITRGCTVVDSGYYCDMRRKAGILAKRVDLMGGEILPCSGHGCNGCCLTIRGGRGTQVSENPCKERVIAVIKSEEGAISKK